MEKQETGGEGTAKSLPKEAGASSKVCICVWNNCLVGYMSTTCCSPLVFDFNGGLICQ